MISTFRTRGMVGSSAAIDMAPRVSLFVCATAVCSLFVSLLLGLASCTERERERERVKEGCVGVLRCVLRAVRVYVRGCRRKKVEAGAGSSLSLSLFPQDTKLSPSSRAAPLSKDSTQQQHQQPQQPHTRIDHTQPPKHAPHQKTVHGKPTPPPPSSSLSLAAAAAAAIVALPSLFHPSVLVLQRPRAPAQTTRSGAPLAPHTLNF